MTEMNVSKLVSEKGRLEKALKVKIDASKGDGSCVVSDLNDLRVIMDAASEHLKELTHLYYGGTAVIKGEDNK